MTSHQQIATKLLEATKASRTTVRLLDNQDHLLLIAEVCAPGVELMGEGPQIDPRQFPTYQYLEQQKDLLVQEDCRNTDVPPPPSLMDHYDVAAQMLAPVIVNDVFRGTVSVHQQGRTRLWTKPDIEALRLARKDVESAVKAFGTEL